MAVRLLLPELFDRNRGPPLLLEEDAAILEDVFLEAEREMRIRHRGQAANQEIAVTIAVVRENFTRICDALRVSPQAKSTFINGYPDWDDNRRNNTEKLRGIAKALHLDRKNSNTARIVSNVTSLIGGAMMVGGAVLIPVTLGASSSVALAGASLTALGSSSAVGTSITETVLMKNNVKAAQKIIDQDTEASAELNRWMIHSVQLTRALDEIQNIDIVKDVLDTLRDTLDEAVAIRRGQWRQEGIKLLVAAALTLLEGELGTLVQGTAILISMLVAIILLRNRNALVCDCAALTFRVVLGIVSFLDGSVDIGLTLARIITGNTGLARGVGAAVARGAVAVLSMTLDTAMIIITSIDIHNGSVSKQGEAIMEAVILLEKETERMKEIYDYLRRHQ